MHGFHPNYDQRLESLINRRTASVPMVLNAASGAVEKYYRASPVHEVYQRMPSRGTAVRYAVGAMQRVDPKYTEITYGEGNRVRDQLKKWLVTENCPCEFEYQGSVTSDTHIRAYSDIDLLAITQLFVMLESPQKPANPYVGDPEKDLLDVRTQSVKCLKHRYPAATVDESGAKAIAISGGSLQRMIDIVPANWFDTTAYAMSKAKRDRAIQILDCETGCRLKNQPFLHNFKIEMKDRAVVGGLRKAIRLMKTLKYDSGEVKLSSYDIAGLAYNMEEYALLTSPGRELLLVGRVKEFLDTVGRDTTLRTSLYVPDGSRRIFCTGHATREGLQQLQDEVDDLVVAIQGNLSRSLETLEEARVLY